MSDPLEKVTGVPAAKVKDFPTMLQVWLPEIKRALPKHLNGDRMARIALTAFRRTPKLAQCDPKSVFAAVIQASQLGLEPDTLGRSYLIPYGNECQFVPGWKGLVDLMNRSGQGSVYTGVIFKDQRYEFIDGSKRELIIHNETELADPSDITHAFAVGHIKGGMFPQIELWRIAKVLKHRDRYNKVGGKHYSYQQLEMYARKVVLLQVLKYMPCSPELVTAMSLNDAAEMGSQKLDLKEAIEGSWEHVPEQPEEQQPAARDEAPKEPRKKQTTSSPGAAADAPQGATSGTASASGGEDRTTVPPKKATAPTPPAGAMVHFFDERKNALGALPYRQGVATGANITMGDVKLHITELTSSQDPMAWIAQCVPVVPESAPPTEGTGKPPADLMDKADAATGGPAEPKPRAKRGSVNFGDAT